MKRTILSTMLLLTIFAVANVTAEIRTAQGWRETFFVTWDKAASAESYTVEYRTGNGEWVAIDDELIREYPNNIMRADVLGISAGTYEVRVTPAGGSPMTRGDIAVTAHERTGFAFMNGVVPGAYNADGTLKDGAVVIYVTDQNMATISAQVVDNSRGTLNTFTGIQQIIKAFEKGYEDRAFAFRFIGRVTADDMISSQGSEPNALDGGDINIKGSSSSGRVFPHLTFEGVGNDAVLYGFGIKTTRAKFLEIRNLAFMLTRSTELDNVGLNSSSEYVWIHHNDMFYGSSGGDSDQAKGDGATDAKASSFITIAYNRYWDTGKTHLLGNSTSETPGNITLHHNWYDHSDSRHPRVRMHNVHVYNNFYNNVSTYGIGASEKSSIFAERNYFANTHRPMTISMQGSDSNRETFSSEDGGMIKAFDNFLDEYSRQSYTPWSASGAANTDFDAYEVTSATATVPASVAAKKGGWTFNNAALLPSDYPAYTTQRDSTSVRERVMTYAGRYWRGDFSYDIDNGRSGNVISGLMTALQNYRGCVIAIQGTDFSATPGSDCGDIGEVVIGGGDDDDDDVCVGDNCDNGNDDECEGEIVDGECITLSIRNNFASANYRMNIANVGNGAFRINYTMRNAGNVKIELFDIRGRRVRTLVNTSRSAGNHNEIFNIRNLSSSTYIVRMQAGGMTVQERVSVRR